MCVRSGGRVNQVRSHGLCFQPLEHSPRRFEVFLVVGEDFVHQFLPFRVFAGLRRLDEFLHRPLPVALGQLALVLHVLLDDLQAEAWYRQHDGVLCDSE